MKDRFGVEMLPSIFRGTGEYKDYYYKLLKVNRNIVFYEVTDSWDYRYEVAQIEVYISPFTNKAFEHYPSDKQLGKKLWRFDDGNEALEFFKSKIL
jgi:hypothetical protein